MARGGTRPNSGKHRFIFVVEGKKFESLESAAAAFGVSKTSIHYWCSEGHRKHENCWKELRDDFIKIPEKDIPDEVKKEAEEAEMDPKDYLLKIMRDENEDPKRRDTAAYWLLPNMHPKATTKKAKKQERSERAKSAGKGKFAPGRAPINKVIPFEPKN